MTRQVPLWRRPAWAGLGLLLALNLIVLLTFTLPRGVAARQLDARLRELQADVEARRVESEQLKQRTQLLQDNARDARRLLEHLVGRRETTLVPILAEIERHASELGVVTGTRALTPDEFKDTPLTQLEISVPFEGSYGRLVGFIRRLEHSPSFLTVDSLRMAQKQDQRSVGRPTLHITISAYFTSGPAVANEEGATRGR